MGSTAIKIVRDKKYLYYIYYDNGSKHEMYCGVASDGKSKRNAIEFELKELKLKKNEINGKIKQLESKLK